MTKLEQFYNAIPESVRERYGITFRDNEDGTFVNIKQGVWTNIRERDVDFEKYECGVEVLEHSVTIHLRNVAIIIRIYESGAHDVQLVLFP